MTMTKAQEFEGYVRAFDAKEYDSRTQLGAWALEHRALIARALRRDGAIENPTYAACVPIGQAVENPAEHAGWDDRGFAALKAFGEAVT